MCHQDICLIEQPEKRQGLCDFSIFEWSQSHIVSTKNSFGGASATFFGLTKRGQYVAECAAKGLYASLPIFSLSR